MNGLTILSVMAGSQLHGVATSDSDADKVEVVIESKEHFIGFNPAEHEVTFKPDVTRYGLRKFLRLALQGNPQLIETLFVPTQFIFDRLDLGFDLQQIAPEIVSREAGKRYLGYMESQRQKLLGERGQKRVTRTELVEAHGYDTKFAGHMIRLGIQGKELLETGKLTLPLAEKDREIVLAIRSGTVPMSDVLQMAGELERDVKDLITDSPIQASPDREYVENWMMDAYLATWELR